MSPFIKKALTDIRLNRFLNLVTIFTISLSILVVSVFMLFFENAGRVIEAWNQGGRAMIYLKADFTMDMLPELKDRINGLGNVQSLVFISKDEALDRLKKEISSSSAFLKTLQGNPLPDAL
jgi:cell division transport system permease protein